MIATDPELSVALLTSVLVATSAMVGLGLTKRRLNWRTPYCHVCRHRHRGACKIRLTL